MFHVDLLTAVWGQNNREEALKHVSPGDANGFGIRSV